MTKKYLMNVTAIAAVVLLTTGCNHDAWNQTPPNEAEQKGNEYAANFKNLVLGGNAPDASQTWSTAANSQMTVSVNLDAGVTYRVFIFSANPVIDASAAYLAKANIASGSQQTLKYALPADVQTLFVAYLDQKDNMFAIPVDASQQTVTLGTSGAAASRASRVSRRAVSVTTLTRPTVSQYKTGAVALTDDNAATVAGPLETGKKMIIEKGTKLTAILANVKQTNGGSVYVEGEWEISGDQRFAAGTHLIIADGGKVTVKEGGNLINNNDNNQQDILPGLFYVMPGGTLTGDGYATLCNAVGNDMCYNGGTISIKQFNLNGSRFYNDEGAHLLCTYLQNGDGNAVVINHGEVHVKYASDAQGNAMAYCRNLAIENACQFTVDYQLTISNVLDSKIADGGYLSVGALKMDGGNGHQLLMGENAVIEIGQVAANKSSFQGVTTAFGEMMIGNFGIVGPTSDNQNRAFIKCEKIQNAYYTTTSDKIQNKMTLIVADKSNSGWLENPDYGMFVNGAMFGTTANYTIDTSECTAGIQQEEETANDPEPSWCYFAFEDLGSTGDIDFNDVVVRVSSADENGDCKVELCAVGGTLNSTVYCSGDKIGNEVHSYSGWEFGTNTKTATCTKAFQEIGTVRLSNYGVTAPCDLPMAIQVQSEKGQIYTVSRPAAGAYPFCITVNGNDAGKWFWPREYVNIGDAYLTFAKWGTNRTTASDWYKSPVTSNVVTY